MADFTDNVLRVVKAISRGKVMSYREVAKRAGFPNAARAVGNLMAKNKDPKVPCHRVICSNGKIGGYNKGIQNKIKKLKEEGVSL